MLRAGPAGRGEHRRAGAADEGFARAGQHIQHRLGGAPVDLDVLHELGEVVDEGGVDHTVGLTGAVGEALGIAKVAPAHLDALGGQPGRALVAARQPDHLVAGAKEVLDDDLADEARGAGDEYTHDRFFRCGWLEAFSSIQPMGKSRELIRVCRLTPWKRGLRLRARTSNPSPLVGEGGAHGYAMGG